MAKALTLYSMAWQTIIERRPDLSNLNLKEIWGRDVIREARVVFDMDRVLLASLMKASGWRPNRGGLGGGLRAASGMGDEGYYNSMVNNINSDGLSAFIKHAIEASYDPRFLTTTESLTDDEAEYLSSVLPTTQPAPAQWGTW